MGKKKRDWRSLFSPSSHSSISPRFRRLSLRGCDAGCGVGGAMLGSSKSDIFLQVVLQYQSFSGTFVSGGVMHWRCCPLLHLLLSHKTIFASSSGLWHTTHILSSRHSSVYISSPVVMTFFEKSQQSREMVNSSSVSLKVGNCPSSSSTFSNKRTFNSCSRWRRLMLRTLNGRTPSSSNSPQMSWFTLTEGRKSLFFGRRAWCSSDGIFRLDELCLVPCILHSSPNGIVEGFWRRCAGSSGEGDVCVVFSPDVLVCVEFSPNILVTRAINDDKLGCGRPWSSRAFECGSSSLSPDPSQKHCTNQTKDCKRATTETKRASMEFTVLKTVLTGLLSEFGMLAQEGECSHCKRKKKMKNGHR